MFSRREKFQNIDDPIAVRWETSVAEFLMIEISPSHIYILKIDKKVIEKGGNLK